MPRKKSWFTLSNARQGYTHCNITNKLNYLLISCIKQELHKYYVSLNCTHKEATPMLTLSCPISPLIVSNPITIQIQIIAWLWVVVLFWSIYQCLFKFNLMQFKMYVYCWVFKQFNVVLYVSVLQYFIAKYGKNALQFIAALY